METSQLASDYFAAWNAAEFDRIRGVLADDASFAGPMGTATGADECLKGLQAVRGMVDEIAVVKLWVDGADAITWFEFRRAGQDPIPVVNWSHVEDGRIARIRATFDPRPLLPPS